MAKTEGLQGEIREKSFMIEGLDCLDCARKLEADIRRQEGISEAVISYATGKLHLRYQSGLENVAGMVRSHGYRLTDTERSAGGNEVKRRAMYAIFSTAAVLLAVPAELFFPEAADILLLIAVITGGHLTFRRGFAALRRGRLDMNVLMTLAVGGALFIGEWWEAATVAFLFAAGHALETYTTEKNRRSIHDLMDSVPDEANLLENGQTRVVPSERVALGDFILVRPGERIPLDGLVVSGTSYVSEAAVTGESLPVTKEEGSRVYAGTLNANGSLTVRVTGTVGDSTLAQIVRLVEKAQSQRAPAQQFIDRFARIYTPAVLALAVALMLAGPAVSGGGWREWMYRGLSLLILACPCALVVSTPVSIAAALTSAARSGVLVKGGVYLEQMGAVKALLFDKTGTLTAGAPRVSRVTAFGQSEEEISRLAASLEVHSEHLLAAAIRDMAKEKSLDFLEVAGFRAWPGKGVAGTINGITYYLGSWVFIEALGLGAPLPELMGEGGETAVVLAGGERVLGVIWISDTLRSEGKAVISRLREQGVEKIAMLTGDREEAARPLGALLGLDEVAAGLMPREKEERVARLRREYGAVAMVGDGINDAPALASASVGIAMGAAGSPTALEAADVALMGDDLTKLPFLIDLSRLTIRTIRQNIALALIIKGLALALAMPGLLTLWLAILADMGASLLVTANGMRLLRVRPRFPFDTSSRDVA